MNNTIETFCKRIELRYCVIERMYGEAKKWYVTAKNEYFMIQFAHRFTISKHLATGFNAIDEAIAFARNYEDTVDQIEAER